MDLLSSPRTLLLLLSCLVLSGVSFARGNTQRVVKNESQPCNVPESIHGHWKGDPKNIFAFERLDFDANRAFRIYQKGKVTTMGTWSVNDKCVLTARTLQSKTPWVFYIRRFVAPDLLLLREDADPVPTRYTPVRSVRLRKASKNP